MLVAGIAEAVGGEAIWAGAGGLLRRMVGGQIRITDPRPQEALQDKKTLGPTFSYRVEGTLKSLRRGHAIWLLTEDERSGKFWPQGFFPVLFNPQSRDWFGRVTWEDAGPVKVHAIVAPPTTQDFFRYFQKIGTSTGSYQPLDRIPVECTNHAYVQALLL